MELTPQPQVTRVPSTAERATLQPQVLSSGGNRAFRGAAPDFLRLLIGCSPATRQPIMQRKGDITSSPPIPLPQTSLLWFTSTNNHVGEGQESRTGEVIAPPQPLLIGCGARGCRLAALCTSPSCRYSRHCEEPLATPEPGIRVSRGPGSKMFPVSSETQEELPFPTFSSSPGFFGAPCTLSHGSCSLPYALDYGPDTEEDYYSQQALRSAGQQTLGPRLPSLFIGGHFL